MPRGRRAQIATRRLAVCLLTGLVAATAAAPQSYGSDASGKARVVFSISSPLIRESSSLVVSTVHPGLVYTANDSGDSATVYVLDASDGALVGRTTLSGVTAVDIEAMAVGDHGTLIVGDIGDNSAVRGSVALYRLPQPDRGASSVVPEAVRLTYAGGARDAESLLYDDNTGRAFVVSKLVGGAKVYRSPPDIFARRHATLLPIAGAPRIATDATFVDGHRYALIRSYFSAVMYSFPGWRQVASFDLPRQPQGESVAALPGGRYVLIGSEGVRSKVLRFRLPDLRASSRPDGSAQPGAVTSAKPEASTAQSRHREHQLSIAKTVVAVAGAGILLVLLTGLVLNRRAAR
jgi:hypothetical protein